MIKSFANSISRKIASGKLPKSHKSLDLQKLMVRLTVLNDISGLEELPKTKSYRLHGLSGNRKGQFAIIINGLWRLCFKWDEDTGDAYDVEIVDYH
jgi:proteic killer suppression protein